MYFPFVSFSHKNITGMANPFLVTRQDKTRISESYIAYNMALDFFSHRNRVQSHLNQSTIILNHGNVFENLGADTDHIPLHISKLPLLSDNLIWLIWLSDFSSSQLQVYFKFSQFKHKSPLPPAPAPFGQWIYLSIGILFPGNATKPLWW